VSNLLTGVVAFLVLAAGCGGSDSGSQSVVVVTPGEVPEIVITGEIEKPEPVVEAPVVGDTAAEEEGAAVGGGNGDDPGVVGESVSVKPTVPLAPTEDDPLEDLADSFGDFADCMLLHGYDVGDLVGDLTAGDTSSLQKIIDRPYSPAYDHVAEKCMVGSEMVNTTNALMGSLSDLTPEQIRKENKVAVFIVDCMGGRGWQMELLPDENGLLMPDEDNVTPPANVNPSNVMTVMMEDIEVCTKQLAEDQLGQGN